MGLFGKPDPKPAQETQAPQPQVAAASAPAPRPVVKSTVMGEKTRYTGKVETDEPLLIQGPLDGEIKSTSEVEVGETGDVKAGITAKSIVISGKVTGDCVASDRLEIRASGRLHGSFKATRVVIADGAELRGTSQMTGGAQP